MISGDPEMLHAAVFNLLHNAFKFTQRHTEVTLGGLGLDICRRSATYDHTLALGRFAMPSRVMSTLKSAHFWP